MEYCRGKNLKEMIDSHQLNPAQNWKLIRQILEAVRYIHEMKLIHRDLKPGNIFLDENFNVKLGDFGLAKIVKSNNNNLINSNLNFNSNQLIKVNNFDYMTIAIGTKYYCSPEQENCKNYNEKTDIFSIGIIIFEMFYFFNSLMERDKVLRNIKENSFYPEDFNQKCELKVVEIVKNCTNKNPNKRPSAEFLLNSIPIFLNEERVVENFKQIIFDNERYSERFLEILITKNLENIYEKEGFKDIFFKKTNSLLCKYIQNNINYLSNIQTIRNRITDLFLKKNSFFY
jgi:serine/threonine protein kinase